MNSERAALYGTGRRTGEARLMLQARARQRDGEDDLGSWCDADNYQGQLGMVLYNKGSLSHANYVINSNIKM
jgi:hypothetical protein